MKKHRKNWSVDEKVKALQLLKLEGASAASRQLGVSSTSLYKWERAFDEHGIPGLQGVVRSDKDYVIAQLEKENRELKLLVAEKELALRVSQSLLKKNK